MKAVASHPGWCAALLTRQPIARGARPQLPGSLEGNWVRTEIPDAASHNLSVENCFTQIIIIEEMNGKFKGNIFDRSVAADFMQLNLSTVGSSLLLFHMR